MVKQLDASIKSIVRSSIYDVLTNQAKTGSLGPIGCRDVFLRAANVLADKNVAGVEKPRGNQNFGQFLKPHRTKDFPNFGVPSDIARLMREVLWDLYVLRFISPAASHGEIYDDTGRRSPLSVNGGVFLDLDQLIITTHGSEVLLAGDNRIQVYDPDGYLSFFSLSQPPPDPEMMRYLTECIQVFRSNYLIAAVVLLGASSERLIDVAASSLCDALGEPSGSSWYRTKYRNKRDISVRFKAFEGTLMREFGNELKEAGLGDAFQGIVKLNFEVIRNARNAIAHPSGKVPNSNEVAGMIHNFTLYFDHLNLIIAYLHNHPRRSQN